MRLTHSIARLSREARDGVPLNILSIACRDGYFNVAPAPQIVRHVMMLEGDSAKSREENRRTDMKRLRSTL